MKTYKVPILEVFVPKAAMFGMRNVVWVMLALCHLPNFICSRRQCSSNTFPSHVLDGCVDCPDRPRKNCKNEDINDIIWCLKSCMKANTTRYHENKPTPTVNHPPSIRAQAKTKSNLNESKKLNRQYIIGISLDHFIVLVCVVVIGVPALVYAFWKCPRVNGPTFAGYRLMIVQGTAIQTEQAISGDDRQREPVAIRLTQRNQGEQV